MTFYLVSVFRNPYHQLIFVLNLGKTFLGLEVSDQPDFKYICSSFESYWLQNFRDSFLQ